MRLRVVDYVGSLGGGMRFGTEVVRALAHSHPNVEFELVSYGACLDNYRGVLRQTGIPVRFVSMRPGDAGLNLRSHRLLAGRIGRIIRKLLAPITKWHYDVPAGALANCDRVWMPWIHWHRVSGDCMGRVVASFHDTIIFDVPGMVPPGVMRAERDNVARWLGSGARVVVSSHATANRIGNLFGMPTPGLRIVRLSAGHASAPSGQAEVPPWGWLSSAFLLNASNTNRHKNHETLLKGVALWGKRYPLVLAGEGSDLRFGRRALQLRQYARQLGFVAGNSLHPLGYVSEGLYRALLGRAWAVVVASRAEGGGSFPAWEAIECGVPVICAETPAVQEHLDWLGAKALWFDPDRPDVLADRLSELERDYDHFKAVALAQRASIRRRSWEEVAKDYWDLILNAE